MQQKKAEFDIEFSNFYIRGTSQVAESFQIAEDHKTLVNTEILKLGGKNLIEIWSTAVTNYPKANS